MNTLFHKSQRWIFAALSLATSLGCGNKMVGFSGGASTPTAVPSQGSEDLQRASGKNPDGSDASTISSTSDVGTGQASTRANGVDQAPMTFEKSFALSRKEHTALTFPVGRNTAETSLTMHSDVHSETVAVNQINRQEIEEIFRQGKAPSPETETFTQGVATGAIDILIVIDNSRSMAEEQNNLASKLEPLLSNIDHADWQINVVTTDPRDGCRRALLRKGETNVVSAFSQAIQAGTSGSGNERGILQAVVGLKGSFANLPGGVVLPDSITTDIGACADTPWLRPNVPVGVLIVSDEDNCSSGADCGTAAAYRDASYLTNYLASIRTLGVDARVYGIIKHTTDVCATALSDGLIYTQAVNASHPVQSAPWTKPPGAFGNICDSDYTATLTAISQNVQSILKNQFILKKTPAPGSIKVYLDGVESTSGWNLQGVTLTFTSPPAQGTVVRADYRVDGMPVVNGWDLAAAPALETLSVLVNGQPLASSHFAYAGATGRLEFTPVVQDDAEVRVKYRKASPALVKAFDIGMNVEPSSLVAQVTLNGAPLTAVVSYDAANGRAVFADAPVDNAAIEFTFNRRGAKILTYPLATVSGVPPRGLKAVALDGGAELPVMWAAQAVTFTEASFVEGRAVKLTYLSQAQDSLGYDLPQEPLAGTVVVTVGSAACPADQVTLVGRTLTLACPVDYNIDDIKIAYDYAADVVSSFDLAEVPHPDAAVWEVFIDGKKLPAEDFSRVGSVISLKNIIVGASSIKIIATVGQK